MRIVNLNPYSASEPTETEKQVLLGIPYSDLTDA
jgi:hypothetical protein